MKKCLLGFVLLALVSLPSGLVLAETEQDVENQYRQTLMLLIGTLLEQVDQLQQELEDRQGSVVLNKDDLEESALISDMKALSAYKISRVSDVDKIINPEHRNYFKEVFRVFPDELGSKIDELVVFDDADAQYDAFVETIPPDHKSWRYSIHQDMLEDLNYIDYELIVHESAHILSYEEDKNISLSGQGCSSYFALINCPSPNSYLGQFAKEFWSSTDIKRAENFSYSSSKSYEYYLDNEEDYVSDYASLNPKEDFAETFMFYVLDIEVPRGLASDKIEYLEEFSELRKWKLEILSNLGE
jgi:hypothetical protein